MQVPWFSLGIGLLTYLVTGSAVAAVSLYLVFHAVCYLLATALAQSIKNSAEKLNVTVHGDGTAPLPPTVKTKRTPGGVRY